MTAFKADLIQVLLSGLNRHDFSPRATFGSNFRWTIFSGSRVSLPKVVAQRYVFGSRMGSFLQLFFLDYSLLPWH